MPTSKELPETFWDIYESGTEAKKKKKNLTIPVQGKYSRSRKDFQQHEKKMPVCLGLD